MNVRMNSVDNFSILFQQRQLIKWPFILGPYQFLIKISRLSLMQILIFTFVFEILVLSLGPYASLVHTSTAVQCVHL